MLAHSGCPARWPFCFPVYVQGAVHGTITAAVVKFGEHAGSPCLFYLQPPLSVLSVEFDGNGFGSRTFPVDATNPVTVSFQGAYIAITSTVELGTSNGQTLTCIQ